MADRKTELTNEITWAIQESRKTSSRVRADVEHIEGVEPDEVAAILDSMGLVGWDAELATADQWDDTITHTFFGWDDDEGTTEFDWKIEIVENIAWQRQMMQDENEHEQAHMPGRI